MTTSAPATVVGEGDPALALGGRDGDRREVRREGLELAHPRADDARRGDDEDRPTRFRTGVAELAAVVRAHEGRDDLERLAEPHVVGEDAADAGVPEAREPAVAVELVGTQGRPQVGWHLGERPGLEGTERLDVGRPARALLVDDAEGDELVPEVGVVRAEAQSAGLGVGDVAGLLDEVAQPVQLGPVEPEERAGLEEHDLVATRERAEERLEGHVLAVDLDGDPQVEPVAGLGLSLLTPLAGAEPDDRSRRDLLVGRDVAVDLDGDVLVGLEQGQRVDDEPRGRACP